MDKNTIFNILKDWNDWQGLQDIGTIRKAYLDKFEALITETDQVVTVTGPRRAGKSYLMRQMARRLSDRNGRRQDILFINFEDPRFDSLDAKLLSQIYDVYREFMSPGGRPYVFLDEVQEVDGWEKWIRMMHELKKAKVVVSGSNAHMLSRELGTLLTGRHVDLTVLPLSFTEYLSFNGIDAGDASDMIGREAEVGGYLRRYIESGSFPEVVLSSRKREILLNYYEDLLTKDLLRRFRVRKSSAMKALIKYYFSNVGNLVTFSSTGKAIGTSTNTVERFAGYFEDVYLVFLLKRFSFKVKEQEKSPRKVYAIDTGLCNALGFRFSENKGRLAENIVFLALKRRQLISTQVELFYWKDVQHHEVDFVVKDGLSVTELIQVCWDMHDAKTRDREMRGLRSALKELKVSSVTVVTEDMDGEEVVNGNKVRILPITKWLLGEGIWV